MNGDAELEMLKTDIITGWLHPKDKAEPGVEKCWPMRHQQVMPEGIAMKGK